MVVVDFGRGLAGVGAQDAPGVLDEPSFPSDWGGEEQGVEDWAVEAFPGVWPGGHGEQGRAAGLGLQAGQGSRAVLGVHAAAQYDRVIAHAPQGVGEFLQVRDPLGEHEAVAASGQRCCDVGGDLAGAVLVGGQVTVNGGHSAWCLRVGAAGVAVGGGVHVQHGCRPAGRAWRRDLGQREGVAVSVVPFAWMGDGVPGLPDLPGDEVVELVAPVRGGRQAEPAAGRDLLDGILEGRRRDVVAFVSDYQAVTRGQLADIGAAGQGLQGDDVDGPAELGPAAAELAWLDAEELADAGPPLVGQRLAVHQDERRRARARRSPRRRSRSCRSRAGRPAHRGHGGPVRSAASCCAAGQRGGAGEVLVQLPAARSSVTSRRLPASSASDGDRVDQAAGQDQAAVDGLVEALQEPRHVPGGGSRVRCRS